MARYEKITDLIGKTPLVKINKINEGGAIIYAKMECFNPLHSVKDRVALAMIEAAEKAGKLTKDSTIVEPTSGNTGTGLAFVSAVKGYKLILTIPEHLISNERRKILTALGARLELTEAAKGMKGAVDKANDIAAAMPNVFIPQQFENPANPDIHEKTTGPEIWEDTEGKIDILIGGVGTGGTITGAGRYLKSKKSSVKVIAIEPAISPVLSGGAPNPHRIQGIGSNFLPKVYDKDIIDEIYHTDETKAGSAARRAAKEEGILIGISSGAALEAALTISKRPENKGKTIVTVLPDTGERYMSTWLWDTWLGE